MLELLAGLNSRVVLHDWLLGQKASETTAHKASRVRLLEKSVPPKTFSVMQNLAPEVSRNLTYLLF